MHILPLWSNAECGKPSALLAVGAAICNIPCVRPRQPCAWRRQQPPSPAATAPPRQLSVQRVQPGLPCPRPPAPPVQCAEATAQHRQRTTQRQGVTGFKSQEGNKDALKRPVSLTYGRHQPTTKPCGHQPPNQVRRPKQHSPCDTAGFATHTVLGNGVGSGGTQC
jgi:hypothetical protein